MTARRPLGFADTADHDTLAPVRTPTLSLPFVVPTTTPEQQHRAALTVVRHVPREHWREVLEALGLVSNRG